MSDIRQVTGQASDAINTAVADAVFEGTEQGGLDMLAAVSVALSAASDMARMVYGDGILRTLADTILMQKGKPLPKIETNS
jgi:hypothetical protein